MERHLPPGDSPARSILSGGRIPGVENGAAYTLAGSEPSTIPVLVAVPHAGRAYPPALVERLRHPGQAALRLEDRYADRLGEAVAAATGAALLVARAPRAMIDLNRAADDVDWTMFTRAPDGVADAPPPHRPGRRARAGLGLIPRRLPGVGELWKRPHDRAELHARIAGVHAPYHAALAATLVGLRARWGAALLVDLHSMPSVVLRGAPSPELVLGDRFGAACSGALVGSAFAWLGTQRRIAAHNRPYAGGYVLERHGNPRRDVHALQIEVDRACYLDAQLDEPGEGFAAMAGLLAGLVRTLATEVAAIGRESVRRSTLNQDWADAAE